MSDSTFKQGQYVEILAGLHIGKKAWVDTVAPHGNGERVLLAFDRSGTETARVKADYLKLLPLWFAVTGRIPEDDEDDTKIFCVESSEDAIERFTTEMYDEDDKDPADVKAASGTDIIITSVLVSTSEITQIRCLY